MQRYRLMSMTGALCALLLLPACKAEVLDLTSPSSVHTGKIKVKDEMVTGTLSASHVDAARVSATAHGILRSEGREATLTIPYLPGDEDHARKIGNDYRELFASEGVAKLTVDFISVKDPEIAKEAVIVYRALVAAPSAACKSLPGKNGGEIMQDAADYEFRCETQAVVSKMVSDPADLLGRSGSAEGDSRRAGTLQEHHASGTPNDPLKGMSASKVGQ